jgi:predicted PurR-regulated permease PerM
LTAFDKRTAQALFTALVFALVLLFLYAAWRAIIGFLFAIFFAYLLEAPVSRFENWFHGRRGMAIAAVYAIFLAALTLVFLLAGPPFMQEAQKLAQQAPSLVNNISTGNLVRQLGEKHGWSKETIERLNNLLLSHRQQFLSATQTFVVRAARTLQSSWWLLLVPILAIFFLKDGRKFGQIIINSVRDGRYRQIVASTVEEMNTMVGHFIRVQLILAGLAIVVITAVLSLMRVPYAVAVGPCAGALEFIPVVGPVVGGALVMIVALMAGYAHLVPLLLFLILWRGIQDYVTSPRIMGSTLELHPLAVLFGVFAGGEVAGVIGVFLSIPVLATLRILWHTWQRLRRPVELPVMEGM